LDHRGPDRRGAGALRALLHPRERSPTTSVPSAVSRSGGARALLTLNAQAIDKETLDNTLTVLLKHEQDVQRAKRALGSAGGAGNRGDDGDIDYRAISRPRRDR